MYHVHHCVQIISHVGSWGRSVFHVRGGGNLILHFHSNVHSVHMTYSVFLAKEENITPGQLTVWLCCHLLSVRLFQPISHKDFYVSPCKMSGRLGIQHRQKCTAMGEHGRREDEPKWKAGGKMISGPLHPCSRSQKWGAHFPPANSISRGISLPLEHKWMASQGRGIFCRKSLKSI